MKMLYKYSIEYTGKWSKMAFLLTAAMLIFFFAGCWNKNRAESAEAEAGQNTGSFEETSVRILKKPYAVKDWHAWEISSGNEAKAVAAELKGEVCMLVKPIQALADYAECEANMRNFLSLEALAEEEIAAKSEAEIQEAYLSEDLIANPRIYKVVFKKPEGKGTEAFIFQKGKSLPELQSLYIISREKAYIVREWFILALEKQVDELLQKDFLNLKAEDILEIRTEAETPGFQVRQAKPLTWELYGENKAHEDTAAIDSFVQSFLFLRAERVWDMAIPEHVGVIDDIQKWPARSFLMRVRKKKEAKDEENLSNKEWIRLLIYQRDGLPFVQTDEKTRLYQVNARHLSLLNFQRENFLLR